MSTAKTPSIPPVVLAPGPKDETARRAPGRRRRRRWPWVALGLVVLAGGGLFLKRSQAKPPPVDPSSVVTVTRKALEVDVLESGRIAPREKADIKSRIPGQVREVLVREGATVKKGDVLLVLDPTDYERELAKSEADVAQASGAVDFAKLARERAERSVAQGVAPRFDIDQTTNDERTRKTALRAAEVGRTVAQDRLRYTKIVSPIDGTVIARNIEPGESVVPGVQSTFDGKALLTIADLSALLVKVNLNQIDVAKVGVGRKATLTLDALPGKKYEAVLTKVAPASVKLKDKEQEVFPIEAQIDAPDGLVKPGMTADVRVHLDAKNDALVLPLEAIVKESGRSYVMKLGADPKKPAPERTEVTLGLRSDREVEVVGLAEGSRVVLKPPSSAEHEEK
jgi:membrane fusion protein, macrolide-specific efflux system